MKLNEEQLEACQLASKGLIWRWATCVVCSHEWSAAFPPGTNVYTLCCPNCISQKSYVLVLKFIE